MLRLTLVLTGLFTLSAFALADLPADIALLRTAPGESREDVQLRAAWQRLVAAGPTQLLPILRGLPGATPRGANWLVTAAQAIAAREFAAGRTALRAELEAYLADRQQDGRGRRLVYEWLVELDPTLREKLLPTFLDDPSLELRRDAVQFRWEQIDKEVAEAERTAAYLALMPYVREKEQADKLLKLITAAGGTYDLAAHFGYVTQWRVIGPFDHTGVKAFNVAYPPETQVELTASYPDKDGNQAAWKPVAAKGTYATVDLNAPLGKVKGAIGYAVAEVESAREQPVEIRVGSVNAIKIFLNGELLLAHEEYHHGAHMDQYVGRGRLKAGKNLVLLKVCQNEQTESYATIWGFQCRLCDATGGAVPFTVAPVGAPETPPANER